LTRGEELWAAAYHGLDNCVHNGRADAVTYHLDLVSSSTAFEAVDFRKAHRAPELVDLKHSQHRFSAVPSDESEAIQSSQGWDVQYRSQNNIICPDPGRSCQNSGDNSSSEQSCAYTRADFGVRLPRGEGEGDRESHDAHPIRLGSVYCMRVLDAAYHYRAGRSRHKHGRVRVPVSTVREFPRSGTRQIAAPARCAVVEAAVDQAAGAESRPSSVVAGMVKIRIELTGLPWLAAPSLRCS
jgi:hypothetical protein